MLNTILIANRGAIATRVIRTLKTLNIRSVAVYHEEDRESLHVQLADEAVCLGTGSVPDTYLNIEKIIDIALKTGAQAIHPGYGFLSENTEFVKRCETHGIAFIGPTPEQIELFGLKHKARQAAEEAKVPLVPGSSLLNKLEDAAQWAESVSYPIILKSTAGGGGIGMQVCHTKAELESAWDTVKRLSANYFSNDGVFLEKYIENARHIEVQIFGDGEGNVVSFGERDCSAQRRNQKVLEETPAPNLDDHIRHSLWETAEKLMASVNYRNAGTVEFIYDTDENQFYFLEVNTRLQVEHGVTEEVWGVDLVEWMVLQSANKLGKIKQHKSKLSATGHSIQVRIYAEDPSKQFQPSSGLLSDVQFPENSDARIDTWVERGIIVPALFDPMIAKIIVKAQNRDQAISKLITTLDGSTLYGIETNLDYVRNIADSQACRKGELLTRSLSTFLFQANAVQVLEPGTQTTIQDWPGRTGLWHIGVPPSGPMDDLSFRIANHILGNDERCAALEITINGPKLKFLSSTQIAITGAEIDARLNGKHVDLYTQIPISEGDILDLGRVSEHGARSYLAIAEGLQCPSYLGSRSTFTLGQFGGHNGRALRAGDNLKLVKGSTEIAPKNKLETNKESIQASILRPTISSTWSIRVIYGPHGAPDFFTNQDIDTFFSSEWEVHYNSSRTGVRLIGPKPEWARETGGEAGLHPSNIHDNAYAFGSIDFTGDMPVILGPDGPSLGGFVCPATVIQADLWKLGQLKAGAKVKFIPVSLDQAEQARLDNNAFIDQKSALKNKADSETRTANQKQNSLLSSPIFDTSFFQGEEVTMRLAGDQFLLVELGPLELDIERRFKIHALMLWLQDNGVKGMFELTPGIRSLQIHYNPDILTTSSLAQLIKQAVAALEDQKELSVESRIIHLPLSWDDEACKLAIEKYMQSVRPDAPWCPSNLEFIKRINGLSSLDEVRNIVFDASYLVLGLGDVYLGAPVATPLDPRHRLVTTKYNPARTWTAENSVGIGGAYMCIYGMEGPGGYQFVGRTLQMWNRYRQTACFDQPWLLNFFDQIHFYEVSHEELEDIRKRFPLGQFEPKIEKTHFKIKDYRNFLDSNADSISQFNQQRNSAFQEELEQWKINGQLTYEPKEQDQNQESDFEADDSLTAIDSPVSGNVWQIHCSEGDKVQEGDVIVTLESMKMEIDIPANHTGVIKKILKAQGNSIEAGQTLIWIAKSEAED